MRRIPLAFLETDHAVGSAKALDEMGEDLLDHFLNRERLSAGGGQKGEAAHFVVQLFGAGTGAFENGNDHGDAQGHAQQMVEGDTQQE